MAPLIEAILWDNDGVLVDTEEVFFEVTRTAFATGGITLTRADWARWYLGEGQASRQIALALGAPADEIDRLLNERNAASRHQLERHVPVRSGVQATVRALHGRVRMAIVTGSSREQLQLIHRSTGLLPFFECVVSREEYTRPKPDPDAYLTVLRRLPVPPERCVAIEDSPRGVAAAVAAGIRCVVVPTGLTDLEGCRAAYCIERDVKGILRLVDG